VKDIEIIGKKILVKDRLGDLHEGIVVEWGRRGMAMKHEGRVKLRHFFWTSIVWFDIDPKEKEDESKEILKREYKTIFNILILGIMMIGGLWFVITMLSGGLSVLGGAVVSEEKIGVVSEVLSISSSKGLLGSTSSCLVKLEDNRTMTIGSVCWDVISGDIVMRGSHGFYIKDR